MKGKVRAVLYAVCAAVALLAATGCGDGAVPADARTFYVAPEGNDANPGTLAQPWRTLQRACQSAVAGDTVYLRAGTYNERLVPANSGTAGQWITFAAMPGEQPVVDGGGLAIVHLGGVVDLSGRGYIRVSGLQVRNSSDAGILAEGGHDLTIQGNHTTATASSGIAAWGCQRVVIDGNTVESACSGGLQECLTVAGTDTFEVRANVVLDSRKEGICLKDGSRNGTALLNRISGTRDSVGLYVDAWDKHTYNIELARNVVYETGVPGVIDGTGISLAGEMGGLLENVRVHNNLVYHNKAMGIHVSTNGDDPSVTTHPMNNIQIVNNTVYNNGWAEWGGGIAVDNPLATSVVVRNNLCCANLTFQIVVATGVPQGQVTVDHNLVEPYQASEGEVTGTQPVQSDPQFVNAGAADFHLAIGSPAVDRGSSDGAPAVDHEGNARPRGGAIDIGALECH